MARFETLEKLGLLPQLDALERVCAQGQAGKYAGRSTNDVHPQMHITKACGHLTRGMEGEIDEETGEPHLILAACRILFAAKGAS